MSGAGFKLLATFGALGALAGCSSTEIGSVSSVAFGDSAKAGQITGTAQAVVASSLRQCGSRDVITLTPVTEETEKYFAASFGNTEEGAIRFDFDPNDNEAAGKALPSNVRTSNCGHGSRWYSWYRFDNVPAGEYFLVSYLQNVDEDWDGNAPDVKAGALAPRGGIPGAGFEAVSMMKRVTVTAGSKETVHLRPKNALNYSDTPIARTAGK